MDSGRRRRSTSRTKAGGVVAGSVWESRRKIDEVRGGIRVFTDEADSISEENGVNGSVDLQSDARLRAKQGVTGAVGRRKTWKSESFEGFEGNPFRIAIETTELNGDIESSDSIEKNPIQMKTRSDVGNEQSVSSDKIKTGFEEDRDFSVSFDGIQKNPIQIRKLKSESCKDVGELSDDAILKIPIRKIETGFEEGRKFSVSFDGIQKSPIQTRKLNPETCKDVGVSNDTIPKSPIQKIKTGFEEGGSLNVSFDGIRKTPIQIRKLKSESCKHVGELSDDTTLKSPIQKIKTGFEEARDFSVPFDGIQNRRIKSESCKDVGEIDDGNERNSIHIRKSKSVKNSIGIEKTPNGIKKPGSDMAFKQFNLCQEKVITSRLDRTKSAPKVVAVDNGDDSSSEEEEKDWQELVEEVDKEIQVDIEKKSLNIKQFKLPEQKPKKVVNEVKKNHHHHHQVQEKSFPPLFVNKPRGRSLFDIPKTTPISVPNELPRKPQINTKMQSLVDLIMWREISKSALVFVIGTFLIVLSSYYKNFNISFITAVSCLSLIYLALIFLYRSFICRISGDLGKDDMNSGFVIGEEDAIWLLKLVLPYLNEFLLKFRTLFSGDPVTTMKMAVLLFVLAWSGSSITIWKMAKLGFFGVFIVPKVSSSYSKQLTAYGTCWIRGFGGAWESCSYKKALTFAIFILVWHLSSFFVRIWALFILFVALRYYRQKLMLMRDQDLVKEGVGEQI